MHNTGAHTERAPILSIMQALQYIKSRPPHLPYFQYKLQYPDRIVKMRLNQLPDKVACCIVEGFKTIFADMEPIFKQCPHCDKRLSEKKQSSIITEVILKTEFKGLE